MKRKIITALLLAAALMTASGCESDKPSNNELEDILNEQYGDIFNEYLNDDLQDETNTVDTNGSDNENRINQSRNSGPEISNYHVVDIGQFHNGLARVTVYIYDEGYWSTKALAAGYNNGYFLYGYIDIDGNGSY